MQARDTIRIYDFIDHRAFLKAYFTAAKKENRRFSYRVFSREAGLTSPSALKEVIDGKIKITGKSISKYIKGCRLTPNQAKYFQYLVKYNHAKGEKEQNRLFLRLLELRRSANVRNLESSQYMFCQEWFNPAIRELITVKGFKNDPAWIAEHILPNITPAQARRAMELLYTLGLVKSDNTGRLVQVTPQVFIRPEVDRLAVRNLNRALIDRGREAIELFDPADREISGSTIGLSRKTYQRLKEKVRKFKQDMIEEIARDGDESEMVCQLNLQLFPMGKNDKNG